jgi:hypothetical protein
VPFTGSWVNPLFLMGSVLYIVFVFFVVFFDFVVFVLCLVCLMLPVFLDCKLLIVPSDFSNVYAFVQK